MGSSPITKAQPTPQTDAFMPVSQPKVSKAESTLPFSKRKVVPLVTIRPYSRFQDQMENLKVIPL